MLPSNCTAEIEVPLFRMTIFPPGGTLAPGTSLATNLEPADSGATATMDKRSNVTLIFMQVPSNQAFRGLIPMRIRPALVQNSGRSPGGLHSKKIQSTSHWRKPDAHQT